MKQSVILEGPNGAGKSVLGKQLTKQMGLSYIHAGPSPGDDYAAFKACAMQYKLLESGVILDRCTPISRRIYERPISPYHEHVLLQWLRMMEEVAVIIYCTADGDFTEKSYYPEGHFKEVTEKREVIRLGYNDLMATIPHIPYDWRENDATISSD